MSDQPPPNVPRVLIDGEIDIRPNQTVQVLAQPTTHRLIVLNSGVVNQFEVGQHLVLHLPDTPPQSIVIESLDRLSLITRYVPAQDEPSEFDTHHAL